MSEGIEIHRCQGSDVEAAALAYQARAADGAAGEAAGAPNPTLSGIARHRDGAQGDGAASQEKRAPVTVASLAAGATATVDEGVSAAPDQTPPDDGADAACPAGTANRGIPGQSVAREADLPPATYSVPP